MQRGIYLAAGSALALVVGGLAWAQTQRETRTERQVKTDDGKVTIEERTQYSRAPRRTIRSSELTTRTIRTGSDEVGRVHEVVIDPDSGRVVYAIVSYDDPNTWHAVPWSALKTSDDKSFTVSIERERLRKSPGFKRTEWPNMTDDRWVTETWTYYDQKPYWTEKTVVAEERVP